MGQSCQQHLVKLVDFDPFKAKKRPGAKTPERQIKYTFQNIAVSRTLTVACCGEFSDLLLLSCRL